MSNTVKSASAAGPVDALVGARIRLRRTLLGMSQEKLGAALGLTFQQVQKYERGANKVGASRLYEMSKVLDVPIGFFFDDLQKDGGGAGSVSPGFSELPSGFGDGKGMRGRFSKSRSNAYSALDDMSQELLRAFRNISDIRVRRQLVNLVKSMATPADASD